MADFLLAPVRDNPILRRTATLPATAGEGLAAGFTTPGLGSLAGAKGAADVFDEAVGIKEPVPGYGMVEGAGRVTPYGQVRPPASAYVDHHTRVLTKEELDEKYKDLGLKFDGPMSEGAAKVLSDMKRAEIIRKDVMERLGTGGTVAAFAGGLGAMLVDPLEVASTFIPFLGQASKGALIARLGVVRGRIAIGASEGVLGAALTEPLYMGFSKALQLDYTMADALFNLGFGAGLGGAFGGVSGALARRGEVKAARRDAEARIASEKAREARTRPPDEMVYTPRGVDEPLPPSRVDIEADIEARRTAVAQFAQGRTVNVMPREQSLFEFIVARGGINDQSPTYRGEIAARDNPRAGIRRLSSSKSKMDLDDMAELAQEAGFIQSRDPAELLAAIDREERGQRVYSAADIEGGQARDQALSDVAEAEADIEQFNTVLSDLEADGITGVSASDVDTVRAIMARDQIDAPTAFERLAIQEMDPARDFSGDPGASRAADEIDDFDPFNEENDALMAIIANLRDNGALPPGSERALADADALSEQAKAMGDVARVAAACLAR